MKASYNWLKSYLNIDIPVEELGDILTEIGLEVEGIETHESIKGGLEGLVVGHVLECGKHENSDKLSVTKVDLGTGEPVQIVCGAPNVAANQKVIVATVGTTLYPPDGKDFKIKKSKIRGEASHGMLCGADEIGFWNLKDNSKSLYVYDAANNKLLTPPLLINTKVHKNIKLIDVIKKSGARKITVTESVQVDGKWALVSRVVGLD